MKVSEMPQEMVDVMVTFKGTVYVPDKYYGKHEIQTITKRGFYHKSDGYYNSKDEWIDTPDGFFSIPPRYKSFKGVMLPDGWGGHRVKPEDCIKWEHIKEQIK